jgi:hypothetical protein
MEENHLIFVGFQLTDKVKGLFNDCSDRDRVYLEDPAYLETISLKETEYIGKRIKDGSAIDRIEDSARSVVSLLRRITPRWEAKPSDAMVLAIQEGGDGVDSTSADETDGAQGYDYLSLVD